MQRRELLLVAGLFAFTIIVRVLPAASSTIPESDPYLWHRLGLYLNENGWTSWGGMVDALRYGGGFDSSANVNPAMPYVAAFSLLFGETGFLLAPTILAATQAVGVYFTARATNLKPEYSALSALIYSLHPMLYARTRVGWLDTESVGMIALTWGPALFLYAAREENRIRFWVYSTLSGAAIAFGSVAWAAGKFAAIPAAFYLASQALKRRENPQRCLKTLTVISAIVLAAAVFTEAPGMNLVTFGKREARALDMSNPISVGEEYAPQAMSYVALNGVALAFALIYEIQLKNRKPEDWAMTGYLAATLLGSALMSRLSVPLAVPLAVSAAHGAYVTASKLNAKATWALMAAGLILCGSICIRSAQSPALIETVDGGGWINSLAWIQDHPGRYAAWWDYGYWIQSAEGCTYGDGQTLGYTPYRLASLYVGDPDEAHQWLIDNKADYLIVTDKLTTIRSVLESLADEAPDCILNRAPEWLTLKYESGGVRIYAVT